MKGSFFCSVMVIFVAFMLAGCSEETAVDHPTGKSVSDPISSAGKIVPGVTGGGTFECQDAYGNEVDVTHGFDLRCNGRPNRLELNWDGNRFFLESIDDRQCDEDEEGDDGEGAEFEIEIDGTGRYNGESGAVICASLADSGEPGGGEDEVGIILLEEGGECFFNDEVEFLGDVILQCDDTLLNSGNHSAHF